MPRKTRAAYASDKGRVTKGCIDCGGGLPGALWTRCEEHAMAHARTLMGGTPSLSPSTFKRRFRLGEHVTLTPTRGELQGQSVVGRVARCPQGGQVVVELEGEHRVKVQGGRYYANMSELSELVASEETGT